MPFLLGQVVSDGWVFYIHIFSAVSLFLFASFFLLGVGGGVSVDRFGTFSFLTFI